MRKLIPAFTLAAMLLGTAPAALAVTTPVAAPVVPVFTVTGDWKIDNATVKLSQNNKSGVSGIVVLSQEVVEKPREMTLGTFTMTMPATWAGEAHVVMAKSACNSKLPDSAKSADFKTTSGATSFLGTNGKGEAAVAIGHGNGLLARPLSVQVILPIRQPKEGGPKTFVAACGDVKLPPQQACMVSVIGPRDEMIATAHTTHATAFAASFKKRSTGLIAAYKLPYKDRGPAVKAVWKTFADEKKASLSARNASIKLAWKAFHNARKQCQNPSLPDPGEGADLN